MKTKLFLLLLFISAVSVAQWTQVGSTQFTSFTNNVAMDFNPTNGNVYVIFDDATDGNKPKVMKFDGTNWTAVGGSISGLASANHAIKFNPVTNEPWVAYRRTSDNQMDVYSFDGTNWVARGININHQFIDFKMQIAFNAAGDARVIGKQTGPYRVIQFPGGTLSNTAIENTRFPFNSYDFEDYTHAFNSYNTGSYSFLRKYPIVNFPDFDFTHFDSQSSISIREVEAISGEDLVVGRDLGSNKDIVLVNATNSSLAKPNNATNNKGFLEFKKSSTDNRYYLMYADASDNLSFEKYNSGANEWNTVPSPSITTSNANFFADMNVSSVNGNMYVAYLDAGRVSVKMFTIAPPLSKYYVNANVSGGNGSGDSWANAMTDLQTAFQASGTSTSEIWVAAGTYKPGNNRNSTFSFNINDLKIYGGFSGTETTIAERDIKNNATILSGDLNGDDNGIGFTNGTRSDNAYHVITLNNANNVIIDGFQINDGHANGSSTNSYGGAMYVAGQSENLIIRNCKFNQNLGLTGGAIRSYLNVNTSMTFENTIFFNNYSRYGSGIYFLVNNNRTVSLNMTNCLFYQNIAADQSSSSRGFTGSSLWARANGTGANLTTTITNCTFVNNLDRGTTSTSERGTLGLSRRTDGNSTHNATINNSIFYFNDQGTTGTTGISINKGHVSLPNQVFVNNSIGEDGFANLSFLTNTSSADPLFKDVNAKDFTLTASSPAIDTGDNSKIPTNITTDILGNARILNSTVDMGVYEYDPASLSSESFLFNKDFIKIHPNPIKDDLFIKSDKEIQKIEIYNLLGKLVIKKEKEKFNQLNLNQLQTGVYLIRFYSGDNIISKKIIKR